VNYCGYVHPIRRPPSAQAPPRLPPRIGLARRRTTGRDLGAAAERRQRRL